MRNPTRPRISAALRRMARPSGSFDAARYFRGDHGLRFHNVGTPKVRALAREICAANPAWTMADAMRLAGELMPDPLPRTTLRYAIERFLSATRRDLLASTRPLHARSGADATSRRALLQAGNASPRGRMIRCDDP